MRVKRSVIHLYALSLILVLSSLLITAVEGQMYSLTVSTEKSYRRGDVVTISGTLTKDGKAQANALAGVETRDSQGVLAFSTIAITSQSGTYTARFKLKDDAPVGVYSVSITAAVDGTKVATASTTFRVKAPVTTTLGLGQPSIPIYSAISITVDVQPVDATGTITIQVSRDNATWTNSTSGQVVSGKFRAEFKPELTGTYYFRATYSGDQNYDPSTSLVKTLTVEQKIETYRVTIEGKDYPLQVRSNSSISDFMFVKEGKYFQFTVTGKDGTLSFSEAIFQSILLGGNITVALNNNPIQFKLSQNSTHTSIVIIYRHSTQTVRVTGTQVIPEFPSSFLLVLAVSLALVILIKRHYVGHGVRLQANQA